ncbi:MAG: YggT family protein [Chloroflexota bacterium]
MSPLSTFLVFIVYLCQALTIAIIIRSVLTWFPLGQTHPIVVFLNFVTDPLLVPIRRIMPTVAMFDFSPIVAIIVLYVIQIAAQSAL